MTELSEKTEESEVKLPTFIGLEKLSKGIWKTVYFCFIDYAEIFDHGITENHGKNSRDENTRPYLSPEAQHAGQGNSS